jgi:hypothetical protein
VSSRLSGEQPHLIRSALWLVPSVLATLSLAWLGSVLVWFGLLSLVGSHLFLGGMALAVRREMSRGYTRRLRRLRYWLLCGYTAGSLLLLLPALLASDVGLELIYLATTSAWFGSYRLWHTLGWLPQPTYTARQARRAEQQREPRQREVGR